MINLSTGQLIQLIAALGIGIGFFILSNIGSQRLFFRFLILIIPFQFITSKYGSLNMVLAYFLGISMLLNRSWIKIKSDKNWPLIVPFSILLISFLLSWTQAQKMFMSENIFYIIMLVSNIVLFYISYHIISDENDIDQIFGVLFICNVLVILYCILQSIIGFGEFQLFGIEEFSIQKNRMDRRLVGPFNAAGITAEYLIIQCVLIGYYILAKKKYRKLGVLLICCNIAALIGTGNRGGFISFILAFILFNFSFRKKLGTIRLFSGSILVVILFLSASYYMIKYTEFDVLYERIVGTKIHGITPDTRKGWPLVVEKIGEKPILGHGTCLVTKSDYGIPIAWPKGEIDFHPHNLYLYIFYTLGAIGFVAYCICSFIYLLMLKQSERKLIKRNDFISGLPRLGIIIFIVILVDQVKIELLRWYLLDYQHYLSILFGLFCSLAKFDIIKHETKHTISQN